MVGNVQRQKWQTSKTWNFTYIPGNIKGNPTLQVTLFSTNWSE